MKKHNTHALAPWWLYLVLVLLSLPFILVIAAIIAVIFHIPVPPTGGSCSILDVIAWIVFIVANRHDRVLFKYLPVSIAILYAALLFALLFV